MMLSFISIWFVFLYNLSTYYLSLGKKFEHLQEVTKVCAPIYSPMEWFLFFLAPIIDVNLTTSQSYMTNHLVLLYVTYVFAIYANENL